MAAEKKERFRFSATADVALLETVREKCTYQQAHVLTIQKAWEDVLHAFVGKMQKEESIHAYQVLVPLFQSPFALSSTE